MKLYQLNLNQFLKAAAYLTLIIALLAKASLRAEAQAIDKVKDQPFRFHILAEPGKIHPQIGLGSSYVIQNLFTGLLRLNDKDQLENVGAESCTRSAKRLTCKLSPNHKWSNGERIRAQDYVESFRQLIDPFNSYPLADLLFTVKNAKAIWNKEKSPEHLGVKATAEYLLQIDLEREDPEFEFKLIQPALSPRPPGGYREPKEARIQIVSGPYKIEKWNENNVIALTPNAFFEGFENRPKVEVYFIDSDSTALSLYESNRLDFLRRLRAEDIERFRHTQDFKQIPMARFDYIGFGPSLKPYPLLRKALIEGVNYPQFLKLFDTLSPPGCPSLPKKLLDQPACLEFRQGQALTTLKDSSYPSKLKFQISKAAGDDIARAAEWFQKQWKQNLNLRVDIELIEQGVYLRSLKTQPPDIFRKGVSLDRPTCLSALEIFKEGHPENYIGFNDKKFTSFLSQLEKPMALAKRRQVCRQAIQYLQAQHVFLPLGEMYFTLLIKPTFAGLSLNSLNQLDLSKLRRVTP